VMGEVLPSRHSFRALTDGSVRALVGRAP
jgi:hypothetical protein